MATETMTNDTFTRLIDKHYSPLVVRKYTHWGFPIYVGIITDDDITNLDESVVQWMVVHKAEGWVNNIQKVRNLAGALTEFLSELYGHAEGIGVVMAVDKCLISSLYGDMMNHAMCRQEFYFLLNLSAQV